MVKVGDRIRILVDDAEGAYVKKGDEFIVAKYYNENSISVEGKYGWRFAPKSYEVISTAPPQNPIEYLKTAHANGDTINPEAMLRECFGITKTERVVTEWSEATKREIKVGDRVRIVGDKWEKDGFGHHFEMGDIVEITEIDPEGEKQPYRSGVGCRWLAASDVELV